MRAHVGRMKTRTPSSRRAATPILSPLAFPEFAADVFGEALHHKRVESVANATLGVLQSPRRWPCLPSGRGLALASGSNCKHAIKQVDRLFQTAASTSIICSRRGCLSLWPNEPRSS